KIHDVFGAAIKLGVALLPPEALGLGHGDALQSNLLQSLLHFVEFERLDDGLDLLHWRFLPLACRGHAAGLAAPTVSRVRAKPWRLQKATTGQIFNRRPGARGGARQQAAD